MRIVLFLCMVVAFVYGKPKYTIAIVLDAKTPQYEEFEKGLKTEITQLLSRDFQVTFPKSHRYNGKGSYKRIRYIIDKELRSNTSDMVITIGVLSSSYIAKKKSLRKPVIATMIIDPKMQKIPLNEKRGISNRHNLNYIRPFGGIDDDIETIFDVFDPKKVVVLVDADMLQVDKKIVSHLKKKFQKKVKDVTILSIKGDVAPTLDKIGIDIDVAYVTPLFSITKEQKKQLYNGLIKRRVKSFTAFGASDVELGALLADNSKADLKKITRQIALNVQQIALGHDAGVQDVDFVSNRSIYINMDTASKLGYKPSWELLSRTTIVESADKDKKSVATIESIMDLAVVRNLDIEAANYGVSKSKSELRRAKGGYLPQINLGVEARQIDQDRATASLGLLNEVNVDGYLLLSQQLYNAKLFSQVSINRHFLNSQMHSEDFIKLQIGLQVAQQYINILKLQNILKIQKQNLELTKQNLKAAKVRLQIGVGNVKDIYRWESKLANDKNTLLQTLVSVKQAKNTLLTLLNLKTSQDLNLEDVELDDNIFMTKHKDIQNYFVEQEKFEKFKSYLVKLAQANMPSLAQYDQLVKTKQEIVSMEKKAMYIPNISLEGGVRTHFIQSSNTVRDNDPNLNKYPYADNTDWDVGVYVRFPLYEGGAQQAQIEAAQFELEQAYTKRNKLKNDVTNNLINALYQSRALFLSIKLAQTALENSKKNLAVTQDIYNQGNSSIIYLLDAQSDTLRAALELNNIKYEFLKYLLSVQYYIGQVNFNIDEAQWNEWYNNLITYENNYYFTKGER